MTAEIKQLAEVDFTLWHHRSTDNTCFLERSNLASFNIAKLCVEKSSNPCPKAAGTVGTLSSRHLYAFALQWAQEYRDDSFDNVIRMDECTVQMESHRCFARRKHGETPQPKSR